MSQRSGEALTTWLMFIPLLVVPAVAIFGIPEVSTLSSDALADQDPGLELSLGTEAPLTEEVPPMPSSGVELGTAIITAEARTEGGWVDPFTQGGESLSTPLNSSAPAQPGSVRGSGDPFAFPNSPSAAPSVAKPFPDAQPVSSASNEVLGAGYSRAGEPRNVISPAKHTATLREELSWREVVKKLNELGVRKLQLSQTEEPFVFRFACDLTPGDNPRITHRFEAEAGEPLEAVGKVIEQVESWLAQRKTQ